MAENYEDLTLTDAKGNVLIRLSGSSLKVLTDGKLTYEGGSLNVDEPALERAKIKFGKSLLHW